MRIRSLAIPAALALGLAAAAPLAACGDADRGIDELAEDLQEDAEETSEDLEQQVEELAEDAQE